MSLVGRPAKNHPQQKTNPEVDDRATTPDVFEPLDREFGGFTVDVAASPDNTKCDRFYTLDDDGLRQSWAGERVWCNPPYSSIRPWVEKAWTEPATLVVMLLPANRTEQTWWRDLVEPYRDQPGSPLRTRFIFGRLRFLSPGQTVIGPDERPPFGCVLLIWNPPGPRIKQSLFDV